MPLIQEAAIKNTISFSFALILSFLVCGNLEAQQYSFRHIGLEEGLPAHTINDMIDGPNGLFWLASEGAGLLKYDGYDFQSIRNEEQPVINALTKDDAGNIWYSAEGEITRYNGFIFKDYSLPGDIRIVDLEFSDQLYLLSAAGLVYRFRDEKVEAISTNGTLNFKNLINYKGSVFAISAGKLWELKAGQIKAASASLPSILNGFPSSNFAANHSSIVAWANQRITWLRPEGLLRLGTANGLPAGKYRFAYLSPGGSLVLGTTSGLAILEDLSFSTLSTGGKQVYSVLGAEGEILAATAAGALVYQDSQPKLTLPRPGLVLALAEMQSEVYLGSERGLYRYGQGSLKNIALPGNDFVFSLLAQGNTLWVGTGQGVMRYSQGVLHEISKEANLPRATIFGIKQAPDSSLWFGSYLQGFFRYGQGRWEQVRQMGNFRLDSIRFSCFLPVSSDEIWLGTLNNGLYHLKGSRVEHFDYASVNYSEVRALEFVPNCFNADEQQIWLGTNKGLLPLQEVVERKTRKVRTSLNFIGGAITANALHYGNGKLLAGTENGVQIMRVCDFLRFQNEPRAFLHDVRLFMGEQPGLNSFAEDSLPFSALPIAPELPYDNNYLNFTYGAEELIRPQEILYRYRLLGQEDIWTQAGNRREALFTNLSPGKYTFQVQARRPGMPWGKSIFSYAFEIKRPYYTTWWFIGAILLVAGSLTYLFIRDRIKRLNQRLLLENALLDMERKALRLQMNPHFIFNALDSISSFIFKKDPKQAVRYLNNFAKLMRLTLESSMEHIHPVETEVSILKNYLELEKLRFGNQFDFEIEVDESIDYDVGLPPMLVQPHVENAILHGLKPKPEPGFLKISFKLNEDTLCVVVDDNGIGRKAAKAIPNKKVHRSMATQINRDRLRLLKDSLSDKVDFEIIDKHLESGEAAGTTVIIRLPAEEI